MPLVSWLDGAGSLAFSLSLVGFVLLNAAGITAVLLTRDRRFVNRWTAPFLAANLTLLGTGIGIPLVTLAARTVIAAVTPTIGSDARTEVDVNAAPAGEAGGLVDPLR